MGEWAQFRAGDRVPNDGIYMEIGENDLHMGINNPKTVTLKRGDTFPENSNHNRKWHRTKLLH